MDWESCQLSTLPRTFRGLEAAATQPEGLGAAYTPAGKTVVTTSCADGLVEADIPKDATSCTLTMWLEDFPDGPTRTWLVNLEPLAPPNEVRGAQQRLRNLGYYDGSDSGTLDEPTEVALRHFQEDMLPQAVTGKLDPPTVLALRTVHGY